MAYNTNKLEVILKHEFGDMKMSDVNYPRWESLKASIIAMLYLYTRSIVSCGPVVSTVIYIFNAE